MIEVACALILHRGKVLAAQRNLQKAEGGLWEFPGGKLEPGETATDCIIREIKEELNIRITPFQQLLPVLHHYPEKTISLLPLLCHWTAGTISLQEHLAYHWLAPPELQDLPWCPADVAVAEQLLQWHRQQQHN